MSTEQFIIAVEGSIRSAINRGTCFQVDNPHFSYGAIITRADTPFEAAQAVLYKGKDWSVWMPNGTRLTVRRVIGGTIGGFHMEYRETRYAVYDGEPFPANGVN